MRRGARIMGLLQVLALLGLWVTPARAQSTDEVFDVTTDAIGSIRMITNASQQVVERHDFLPFGQEWGGSGGSIVVVGWAGKEKDGETGFVYFGARYYSPATGRFTGPDDAVFSDPANPQSWNLYVYVLNNPLRFIDPDGHECFEVAGVIRCTDNTSVTAPRPPDIDIGLMGFLFPFLFTHGRPRQFYAAQVRAQVPPTLPAPGTPELPSCANAGVQGNVAASQFSSRGPAASSGE